AVRGLARRQDRFADDHATKHGRTRSGHARDAYGGEDRRRTQEPLRPLVAVMELIVLLSINVAIFNLLPIPILDGGQILINVLESVKGSPFTMRTREYILRFGLVTIGALFVFVMFNDTRDGLSRLVDWVLK